MSETVSQPESERATVPSSPVDRPIRQRQMPQQRWQVFPPQKAQAKQIAEATALSPLLAQVLINRGIYTPEQAWAFLDPETLLLPSPLDEFPDLDKSLNLLIEAIAQQQKILICGDYDADGMTSTALLMRSLRYLGAQVDYAIPSRMDEGYGINLRIVEEFHAAGGAVIITVDNGIAAYKPIARAVELGLTIILTDHHAVPEQIPPATAILNPQLIREASPYRGVAGVGVAYILAVSLAQRMDKMQALTATLLALFTLGTIADLAPLTGVNRRWVRRGLTLLPKSRIAGIQALIEVAGLSEDAALQPEAIGFRLGPRINAVGRIDDPQIVIDLLTTDDVGIALQRAMQCEETNKLRRQLCEVIEAQAVEWCEQQQADGLLDLSRERVLVLVQPEWHHGVIGIVASRLVERYGVPVFIGTYEDKGQKEIRGSARSIPEFNVVEALRFCDDLLDKYGGHSAAGGFSFSANKLRQVKSRLSTFACQHLQLEHLKPLVKVDVRAALENIDLELFSQIDQIHPCGIENPDPVFWTASVRVVEQRAIGKTKAHLKLTVAHSVGEGEPAIMKAIAWRWGEYYPLPKVIDIAYKLRLNEWKGQKNVELEIVGVRPATDQAEKLPEPTHSTAEALVSVQSESSVSEKTVASNPVVSNSVVSNSARRGSGASKVRESPASAACYAEFCYSQRHYKGSLMASNDGRQLTIENPEGHLLVVRMSDSSPERLRQRQGFLYLPKSEPQLVNISELKYFNLVRAGLGAIELKQKTQLLMKQDELLADKNSQIATMKAQIELLEEKTTQLSASQQQQFAVLETERQAQADAIRGQEAQIKQLQIWVGRPLWPGAEADGDVQQQVRADVSDEVWFCLQAASQKDLLAAYQAYQRVYTDGPDIYIEDYSDAGSQLSSVVNREVLMPFFEVLQVFLSAGGADQIGGIRLSAASVYRLEMLPPLLADQWQTFSAGQLLQRSPKKINRVSVSAPASVLMSDRELLQQFFSQWTHPMVTCLSTKHRQAASSLDQISQLQKIATQPERCLYRWQYDLLHQLIAGKAGKGGLLRQIFAT